MDEVRERGEQVLSSSLREFYLALPAGRQHLCVGAEVEQSRANLLPVCVEFENRDNLLCCLLGLSMEPESLGEHTERAV